MSNKYYDVSSTCKLMRMPLIANLISSSSQGGGGGRGEQYQPINPN